MRAPSIYRNLQLWLSGVFVLFILAAGALTMRAASDQIDKDYDGQLIADNFIIWTLVKEELHEEQSIDEVKNLLEMRLVSNNEKQELMEFNQYRAFRVWRDHVLALRSDTAQDSTEPMAESGFSVRHVGDMTWRVYAMQLPQQQITVEVWENKKIRDRLLHRILRSLMVPSLIIIPLLWFTLLAVIRFSFRGFRYLVRRIEAHDPNSLELLDIPLLPREIVPLQQSLNRLIEKLRTMLAHERMFMDSAAHELRTPLAALKLQGQVIAFAPTIAERQAAIDTLLERLDSTVQLANQLLLFSKVTQQHIVHAPVDLHAACRQVLADRALLSAEKQLDITLEGDPQWQDTNEEFLKILVGVLIDNAIKYTPAQGNITVSVLPQGIVIEDSGSGIPDADRNKLFSKFYRGRSDHPGSGLGLAIAKEIAYRLGIQLRLAPYEHGKGLRIMLHFSQK